ncbi:lectin-like protein [Flavobacterium sp. H122]|uniref:lectin-like protein n=1 Tax=Flavobacterium sp. H122 TaxID=2529860 RepID=UPI0010AA8B8D|nr:lectin-like protein [Flavobacterium sp. H122]
MKQILSTVFAILSLQCLANEGLFSYLETDTKKNKSIIIFYRPDCTYCQQMDKDISNSFSTIAYIKTSFNVTLIDITEEKNNPIIQFYQINSVPTILKSDNNPNKPEVLKGYSPIEKVHDFLTGKSSSITKKNIAPTCGNKIIENGEQCDDGNNLNTDGCTRKCRLGVICSSQKYPDGSVFITNQDTGNCYISIEPKVFTWQEAQNYCTSLNGYLTTIANNSEANIINSIILGKQWIGGNDIETEGTFKWVTAEPFSYSKFTSGEPNNDINSTGNGDCLAVTSNNGSWSDTDCNMTNYITGLICEIPNRCGDGTKNDIEQCDDKNLTNGDGCDNNCKLTSCGNGIITNGEDCDDGNLIDGDGCNSNCKLTLDTDDYNSQILFFSIYPNPFTSGISLKLYLKEPGDMSFALIDYTGKTIEYLQFDNLTFGENNLEINFKSPIPSGIYLLNGKLKNSTGTYFVTRKIQKN